MYIIDRRNRRYPIKDGSVFKIISTPDISYIKILRVVELIKIKIVYLDTNFNLTTDHTYDYFYHKDFYGVKFFGLEFIPNETDLTKEDVI